MLNPTTDPAVQALTDDGWLNHDQPLTADDLTRIADTVRAAGTGGTIRTEWATACSRYDGTTTYEIKDDEEHAGMIADILRAHIDSLNEPTRRHNGIASVAVVRRRVQEFAGKTLLHEWQHVRDGQPIRDEEPARG